jgi:hypothetical protein
MIRNVCALGIAVVALSSCGGKTATTSAELPPSVVAQVGHAVIKRTTLDHWISVQAITDYAERPQEPPPPGVVPDPPLYRACITRLRASPPVPTTSTTSTTSLKARCSQNYTQLLQHIMQILITFQWLIGESAARDVKVTETEVADRYARFSRERFPRDGELRKYLAATGESLSDELLRMRMDMLSNRLLQKAEAEGKTSAERLRAIEKLFNGLPSRWVPKTNCRPGYVAPNCRQYHGPIPAEARI